MDHREEHHQHHEKERQHRIEEEKERDRRQEKSLSQIHPAWFVAAGVVLVALVLLTWMYIFSTP